MARVNILFFLSRGQKNKAALLRQQCRPCRRFMFDEYDWGEETTQVFKNYLQWRNVALNDSVRD